MDTATITTFISTVGFPIAACIGLFYLYDRTIKDLTSSLGEVAKTLSKVDATLDGVAKAIDEMRKNG